MFMFASWVWGPHCRRWNVPAMAGVDLSHTPTVQALHRPGSGMAAGGRLLVTFMARKPLVVPRGAFALPLLCSVAFVASARAQAPPPPPSSTSSPAPLTLTLADATARAVTSNPT